MEVLKTQTKVKLKYPYQELMATITGVSYSNPIFYDLLLSDGNSLSYVKADHLEVEQ